MSDVYVNMSVESTTPVPQDDAGDNRWMNLHDRYVLEARTTESDILFIGDSIINQLQFSTLWKEKFKPLYCVNFGVDGDRTQNLLWRILNGELDFITKLKAVVLFIGTNNSNDEPEDVFKGILECIEVIRKKHPSANIIFPTLLPRGQFPNKLRDQNSKVNENLIQYFKTEANSELKSKVHVVPIHENIIQTDGTIPHYIMFDYLHLSDTGYTKIFTPVYDKLCSIVKH